MCTIIAVGPQASADGSTLLSHSDTGPDSRIRRVDAQDHPPGSLAPVHWGLQDVRSERLDDWGEVIGHVPQVAHTHAYFHSAYSHINEHQLALAESTTTQRTELECGRDQGEQIMTIEQAMVLALQRCTSARQAVALVGQLMQDHGFLSSCGRGGELLCVADPQELWVLEVVGVGPGWTRASGLPGAVWAAQRMPADHALVVANWSVLGELDLADSQTVMACAHVRSFAQARGWCDSTPGQRFDWRQAYTPLPREWATSRLWLFYTQVAPSLRAWPERRLQDSARGQQRERTLDAYAQVVEPLSLYPFSVRPEKPLALQDLMAFHRSTMEGTIYDFTEQPQWWVANDEGQLVKSPLATPFPTPDLRRLLHLSNRRPVARAFGHYCAINQLRQDLPNDVAGVYWVALDNPLVSTWVPMHLGLRSVHEAFSTYDPLQFSEVSARWCVDFVDHLMQLGFQKALPLLQARRDPWQAELIAQWQRLDTELAAEPDLERRRDRATAAAHAAMAEVPVFYRAMRHELLVALGHHRS